MQGYLLYPVAVAAISPTFEGFRAAFRRPSFTLAEMAWRWERELRQRRSSSSD